MVFRDLLFVSNTSYGPKIDEMREFFFNKNYLISFFMDFKNSQARQGRAFRHLWQMNKFGKICLLFGSVQPISLRTLVLPYFKQKISTIVMRWTCLEILHDPSVEKRCARLTLFYDVQQTLMLHFR